MKNLLFLLFISLSTSVFSQENFVKGSVFNTQTHLPLENVNIINLNQLKGTTTDFKGDFSIRASVNDTLYFSFLGFKSIKVKVTNDMIKFSGTKIGMSELAYTLDEIILKPYKLTGVLSIDAKYMPVNTNLQYNISGINKGYEASSKTMGGGGGFNLISPIYKLFSSRHKEVKKLQKLKDEQHIKNVLYSKFDREMICEILGVEKSEIEEILRHCNYSKKFISEANDLQILEAITQCYSEYKVLKK